MLLWGIRMMKEVVSGIRTWPLWAERMGIFFYGTHVPEARLIIDPVEPPPDVLGELHGATTIVLTNRNHFRAAAQVKAATGARVLVHPADAAFVVDKGVTVDGAVAAGEKVGPFTVLDASGKSPGEVALHWPERRLLVVGDICVCKTPGELALLPEKVMDDPARLRQSLVRIAATVDFDTVLCGDGEPILSGGRDALRALVASFPS
jgi:glyoxylase-like metal-dependent hydrolase (beta-lactamase superfamily II)